MRAFEAGWGGAVWKTWATHSKRVLSLWRYPVERQPGVGFNNIELITDRSWKPIWGNGRGQTQLPNHAVISSLMVETKEEWKDVIKRSMMRVQMVWN